MMNFMMHDFSIDKIDIVCQVKAGKGTLVHKNRRSHGLALYLGGERTFYFEDRILHIKKNTLLYLPKGSNYTIKDIEPSDCYAINFQLTDDIAFEPFAMKIKNIDSCAESFKHSHKIWTKKVTGHLALVKSELYNIIYTMQSEYDIPYTSIKRIEPAIQYIHAHYYKENISIAHLATLCNISTTHLRNIFIKKFAVSPIKYINNLKLSRAKELLCSQLYTVSEACYLSGYHDESYFCREFKKHFHMSPKKYILTLQ